MLLFLVAGLGLWMLGCAYAGYARRFGLFAVVLLAGIGVNTLWMVFGLAANPLSPPVLMTHVAAVLYAMSALGIGWMIGRMAARFRDSRVDPQ